MAATDERVSNLSLQRQISELTARVGQIAQDIGEIKSMLREVETRVRALENNEAGDHPVMQSKIDAAWRKLDEHDRRMMTMEHAIARLEQSNKILTWLGGILGSTVAIWLVTQILQVIR